MNTIKTHHMGILNCLDPYYCGTIRHPATLCRPRLRTTLTRIQLLPHPHAGSILLPLAGSRTCGASVPPNHLPRGRLMFTLWGERQRFCDGVSRRGFLKIGAFGAGLTLAELLRLRALADEKAVTPNKAAIMIYLPGGPSHMDMYDL